MKMDFNIHSDEDHPLKNEVKKTQDSFWTCYEPNCD
jgi:hypothetical protein